MSTKIMVQRFAGILSTCMMTFYIVAPGTLTFEEVDTGSRLGRYGFRCTHGWPMTFLIRQNDSTNSWNSGSTGQFGFAGGKFQMIPERNSGQRASANTTLRVFKFTDSIKFFSLYKLLIDLVIVELVVGSICYYVFSSTKFSLSTIFIITTMSTLPFYFYHEEIARSQNEQRLIKLACDEFDLREVIFESRPPIWAQRIGLTSYWPMRLTSIKIVGKIPWSNEEISRLNSLESVTLSQSDYKIQRISQFLKISTIRKLCLESARIRESSDWRGSLNSSNVKHLVLTQTLNSQSCLKVARNAKWLEILELQASDIKDCDLSLVNQCNKIRYIDVSDTEISDVGIRSIVEFPKLNEMITPGSKIRAIPSGFESTYEGLRRSEQ